MLRFKNCIMHSNDGLERVVIPKEDIKEVSFIYRGIIDSYVKVVETNNTIYHWLISDIDFDGIRVEGHIGTWHTIDRCIMKGQLYFLLEHEDFGDEVANCIIDFDGKLVSICYQ